MMMKRVVVAVHIHSCPRSFSKEKIWKFHCSFSFREKAAQSALKLEKSEKKWRKSPHIFNLYKLILCDMFLYQKIPNFLPILWSLWPLEEVCGKVLELLLLLAAVLKFITSPTFHCFSSTASWKMKNTPRFNACILPTWIPDGAKRATNISDIKNA